MSLGPRHQLPSVPPEDHTGAAWTWVACTSFFRGAGPGRAQIFSPLFAYSTSNMRNNQHPGQLNTSPAGIPSGAQVVQGTDLTWQTGF